MDRIAPFDADRCTQCGICLETCPVLHLSPSEAKVAVKLRAKGKGRAVDQCTSCFTCNFTCPNQANPAAAMLEIWHERAKERGFPARAQYFTPDHMPNFRTYVIDRMPKIQQQMIRSWADDTPCDEILFPGCNVISAPHLMQTKLVKGMNIRGSLDLCCGEMYFRTGQKEMVEKTAQRIAAWQEKIGFKKMVIPCTAGMNMFTNVLPKYGLNRTFEVESLYAVLLRKFKSGELQVLNPLRMTVTVQDSCHGKFFGDEYMDIPRKLLGLCGVKIVESRYSREKMLCCGIGGGFSHQASYHPVPMSRSTLRTLWEARKTGANAIATYCAGCMQMLSSGKLMLPTRMGIYHLIELLQYAIGERSLHPLRRNTATMFQGVVRHQLPLVMSRARYFPTRES